MFKDKITSFIRSFLKKKGYLLVNKFTSEVIKENLIYILLFTKMHQKSIKVIQIGANDGNDLLNKFNNDYRRKVQYIGIEPQEIPFNKLKETYQGFDNFFFIRGCIGNEGKRNFYYYNKNFYDHFKGTKNNQGINSLFYDNLSSRLKKKNLNPDLYIDKYEIEVSSLLNLLKKENINFEDNKNIDLLQIDAEGADDEVIYNSNLDFFRPSLINFEHKNLTKTKLENLIKFLHQKNYKCLIYKHNDALAVKSTIEVY